MKKTLLLLLIAALPLMAWADSSGTCGINVTWTFVESTGTLTISGTGSMYDYKSTKPSDVPWYSYRDKIKSVIIEEGISRIGNVVFWHCSNLASVTIPSTVVGSGDGSFMACEKLDDVYISDLESWCNITFENITSNPLRYAKHLLVNSTEVVDLLIPSAVTTVKNYAFVEFCGLKTVTFHSNVASIGVSSFDGCTGLLSVVFPESINSIGEYAFRGCSNLERIELPDKSITIGYFAFNSCALKSIFIPALAKIEQGAFEKNPLTAIHISDLAAWCSRSWMYTVQGPNGTSYSYANPLQDAQHLYLNGVEVKNLVIPETVRNIGNAAFYGCKGLTSVVIPPSVQYIGKYAFYDCGNITSLDLSGTMTTIPEYAFYGCSSLTSITIPSSVINIDDYAFHNCRSLSSVSLPNSLEKIKANNFNYCTALNSIIIPESVKEIGDNVFYKTGMYENQPDGLIYFDNWCGGYKGTLAEGGSLLIKEGTKGLFNSYRSKGSYKTNWTSVLPNAGSIVIPNSVKYSSVAFSNMPNLLSVSIGSGLNLNSFNFTNSTELTSVIVDCKTVGGFKNLKKLKTVVMGYSVRTISDYAFQGCESLEKVRLPNGIESVGQYAFEGCTGMTTLTIPNSINTIDQYAFSNALGLTSVTTQITIPRTLNENGFTCTASGYDSRTIYYVATLYVPRGRKAIYENISAWKLFSSKVEADVCYTLTYVLDGVVYKSVDIQPGVVITPEPAPVKSGFVFDGWRTVPDTMPEHDVIVYGHFEPYTTSIKNIIDCDEYQRTDNKWYNKENPFYSLSGQRLAAPKKGLNIVDGRKVVVK